MENREKLLSCALDLFYARGYDAVGIQEIVDAAGVTKPTMYYYFGSKKGLLEDLIQGIFNDLMEALGHACARRPEDHFPDILFRIAGAFLRYAVSHEKEYRFVLALYYTGEENEGHLVVRPLISRYYSRRQSSIPRSPAWCWCRCLKKRQQSLAICMGGRNSLHWVCRDFWIRLFLCTAVNPIAEPGR